jgi:hypothetical protein
MLSSPFLQKWVSFLIRFTETVTVQTGAITAVAALADVILFLAFPVSLAYMSQISSSPSHRQRLCMLLCSHRQNNFDFLPQPIHPGLPTIQALYNLLTQHVNHLASLSVATMLSI